MHLNQNKDLKTVVVLGNPRSGASTIAGMLSILGVEMSGSKIPLPVAPKGSYEDPEFSQLIKKIFIKTLNYKGNWDGSIYWGSLERLYYLRNKILFQGDNFNKEIKNLILNKGKNKITWGWKYPATHLVIELFLPYLINPHFVVCFRDPLKVAQSSQEFFSLMGIRKEISIFQMLKAINFHNRIILNFLERHPDLPRIFVAFEDVIENPIKEAKRLADFLGLELTEEKKREINDFVIPKDRIKKEKEKLAGGLGLKLNFYEKLASLKTSRGSEKKNKEVFILSPLNYSKKYTYFESPRPEIVELITEDTKHILDVGCGTGRYGAMIKSKYPHCEITGIEIIPEIAEEARRNLDKVIVGNVEDVDLGELGFEDGYFDCIIYADILEHLNDPWTVVYRHKKFLKDGGKIIASIPNIRNLQILTPLLNEGRWTYKDEGILDATHLRFFTRKEIERMFSKLGFRIKGIKANPDVYKPSSKDERTFKIETEKVTIKNLSPEEFEEFNVIQFIIEAEKVKGHRPLCSIVMPVFNKLEYTKQCVEALYDSTLSSLFELIIVNNASSDGTKEYLDQLVAQVNNVKVIHNQENLGFAKACNQGARVAEGKYLVFLNNDTLPLEGWLEEMLKVIENEGQVGAVGSKLLFPDDTIQHAGVGITDSPLPVSPFHLYYKKPADYPKANIKRDYQVVTGACMLIAKELFDRLGGFDEGFLNGYEDVDLCFRVREAGYRVVYTPKSVLYHFESVTPGRFKAVKENEERLQKKWAGKIKPDVEVYFPKVSVIILNYNNSQHTTKCLASIYKNIKYERVQVIVIDNGSRTEDVSTLKKWINSQNVESIFCHKGHFSYQDEPFKRELIFIENQENLGFAGGNNVGIKYALNSGADYIWLLNNDTVVERETLESSLLLAERLKAEKQEKVGIISSKIYCYDDKSKVQYDGEKPLYKGMPDKKDELPRQVEFAPGCSLLIDRRLFEEIGLLNEDYFLYYEDTEFCMRALKAGWTIWYNPYSKVYHKGGASVGPWLQSPLSAYYATRNILLCQFQTNPVKVSQIFAYLKNGHWGELKKTPECIFAFVEGIKDFLKGKKGKKEIRPEVIDSCLKEIKNGNVQVPENLEERLEASGNLLILNPEKREVLEQFVNIAQGLFFKNYAKLAMNTKVNQCVR